MSFVLFITHGIRSVAKYNKKRLASEAFVKFQIENCLFEFGVFSLPWCCMFCQCFIACSKCKNHDPLNSVLLYICIPRCCQISIYFFSFQWFLFLFKLNAFALGIVLRHNLSYTSYHVHYVTFNSMNTCGKYASTLDRDNYIASIQFPLISPHPQGLMQCHCKT